MDHEQWIIKTLSNYQLLGEAFNLGGINYQLSIINYPLVSYPFLRLGLVLGDEFIFLSDKFLCFDDVYL